MHVKSEFRRQTLQRMLHQKEVDEKTGDSIHYVTQPEVQAALGAYLSSLKNRKKHRQ